MNDNRNNKDCKSINWVFLCLVLSVLIASHFWHVLTINNDSPVYLIYYSAKAIVLCILEVAFIGIVLYLVSSNRVLMYFFALIVSIIIVMQLVNFPLVKIFDMSIWDSVNFILQLNMKDFVGLFKVINGPLLIIGVAIGSVSVVLCFVIFKYSETISRNIKIYFCIKKFACCLCGGLLILVCFECGGKYILNLSTKQRFQKAMPWQATLFSTSPSLRFKYTLKELQNYKDIVSTIDSLQLDHVKKPNIYLFVVESLRSDVVNESNAPNLYRFKNENISTKFSISSGNATHLSWFSIFHSNYPFYWENFSSNKDKVGSIPLILLKKMGYKIHVHSSSKLNYFQMYESIFGANRYLADNFSLHTSEEACQGDLENINNLIESINNDELMEGTVHIVFLESTHFNYSWPEDGFSRFLPVMNKIDYKIVKTVFFGKELDRLKNRYYNSVYYIDSLFGKFYSKLKESIKGDESIVVFTGDHGEEFIEDGHLFHGSTLNKYQTHVPIIFKLGNNQFQSIKMINKMSSHVDIFPTIFNYILGEEMYSEFFQGESIFKTRKNPFVISCRFNINKNPYEFLIQDGRYLLTAKLNSRDNVSKSNEIEIVSFADRENEIYDVSLENVNEIFKNGFDVIFAP